MLQQAPHEIVGARRRRGKGLIPPTLTLAMELQHFVAKIHVDGPLAIDPAKVVDIFHSWVAAQTVPGVLLVDVAELLHVPDGPGVIAVGYEADYALDHTDGIWGALYRRKNVLAGTNTERVAEAQLFAEAVHNCYNKIRTKSSAPAASATAKA